MLLLIGRFRFGHEQRVAASARILSFQMRSMGFIGGNTLGSEEGWSNLGWRSPFGGRWSERGISESEP